MRKMMTGFRARAAFGVGVLVLAALPAAPEAGAAAAPTFSVGAASVVEGDSGSRVVSLPVTLADPATTTVAVNYAVTAGTASAGTEVKLKSGRLTFTPAVRTGLTPVIKFVPVTVFGDTSAESDETFSVTLSAPTGGATIGRAVGVGTVLDDDPGSGNRVAVGDAAIVEGDHGPVRTAKVTVSRSGPDLSAATTVHYTVTALTATPPTDVAKNRSGNVVFKPGQIAKVVAVKVLPDATPEPDETVVVALSAPTGGTVTRANGTVTILDDDAPATASTTTALVSGTNPSAFGGDVTFTATVSSSVGTPTGTVSFSDGPTVLGTAPLGGGTAAFTTSALTVGDHTITAGYGGDAGHTGSTSAGVTQSVVPAATTTALTSDVNPSGDGDPVTFTATVTSPGGVPEGTVVFSDDGTPFASVATSGGVASASTGALGVGSHAITARYAGAESFAASLSDPVTQVVEVALAPTTTVLDSDANPSAYGGFVTLTATVTTGVGAPAGTVAFLDGATLLETVSLVGGSAATTTSTLTPGTHTITAVYGGDPDHAGSTSDPLDQVIQPATAFVTLSSNANPTAINNGVTFLATVTSMIGAPTGTVTFSDGASTLGTVSLTPDPMSFSAATAEYTAPALARGTHSITATYSGSAIFDPATSNPVAQVMTGLPVYVGLSSDANPSTYAAPVTVTAALSSMYATPTGSVTFSDGATELATVPLSGTSATFTTADLAIGTHTLTAAYSGDASVEPATSSPVAQVVGGSAYSWGRNTYGQLGDDSTTDRTDPVRSGTATDWRTVAAGGFHSVGIKTDGTLWAWGYNVGGEVGDGTGIDRHTPVQISTDTSWVSVTAGYGHNLAVKADGTLWAWGYNNLGQIGDGSHSDRLAPVQVGSATDWRSASAGETHTLAVKADGTLWAWGSNVFGQLGDGTSLDRATPVRIGGASDWSSVAAGEWDSFAVKSDGTLWGWGYNFQGQVGPIAQGNIRTPTQVGAATDWRAVSPGFTHTLGLRSDGSLWSWGLDDQGQLGTGSGNHSTPQRVGTETTWASIAAGDRFSLAVKRDGTRWAWGLNNVGQLGDGTTTARSAPVQVGQQHHWASVSASWDHAVALRAAPPTVTLTSSPNPSVSGSNVAITARVESPIGTPTGYVAFAIDSCTFFGGEPLVAGSVTVTVSFQGCGAPYFAPGAHVLTAWYLGDATHLASSGQTTQTIVAAP